MKIAVTLILVCGCLITSCNPKANVEQTSVEGSKQEVQEEKKVEVEGKVGAYDYEKIYIEFPAVVEKVQVKEGDIIDKGTTLITFSNDDYLYTIGQKEKEVALLEAEIEKIKSSSNYLTAKVGTLEEKIALQRSYIDSSNDPEIQVLNNSIKTIDKQLQVNKELYETKKELYEVGSISAKELEDLELELEVQEREREEKQVKIEELKESNVIDLKDLQGQLDSLMMQINNEDKTSIYNLKINQTKREMKNEEIQQLRSKLSKEYIKNKAVIATKNNLLVNQMNCIVGTIVGDEKVQLLEVINLDSMIITIDIPVEDLVYFEVGTKVAIQVANAEESEIEGEVSRIEGKVIEVEGEMIIQADIKINKGKELLKVGQELDAIVTVK